MFEETTEPKSSNTTSITKLAAVVAFVLVMVAVQVARGGDGCR